MNCCRFLNTVYVGLLRIASLFCQVLTIILFHPGCKNIIMTEQYHVNISELWCSGKKCENKSRGRYLDFSDPTSISEGTPTFFVSVCKLHLIFVQPNLARIEGI